MPPKVKITQEMIMNAAFEIARIEGADKITARSISEKLNCSTQPVLYHFASVEEIKRAVYQKADEYHSGYIMNLEQDYGNPMLAIGMNYIRFAIEERNLFRFLFQSNEFSGATIAEMMDSEDLLPMLAVLQQELEASLDEAKEIFATLFIFVHGYASMFANNSMVYEEEDLVLKLTKVFYGAVYAAKEVKDEENI
ncbi:MAG: TetR/AcrR family transcriptional regulator [Lachnospiraceae bacterium]|nr:TetR/AcrR family transcriptional regulator [Lachnospiraceae bacterium]